MMSIGLPGHHSFVCIGNIGMDDNRHNEHDPIHLNLGSLPQLLLNPLWNLSSRSCLNGKRNEIWVGTGDDARPSGKSTLKCHKLVGSTSLVLFGANHTHCWGY